ncbi:hypothetical protein niasHS_016233 [Heterodera schachtii]|uniref:Replication factor A C-terminal domain-containing protein n=1 Tax=Heterodera schachtii TaxID=97005 RepID=A0ABD2HUA7_HETSC
MSDNKLKRFQFVSSSNQKADEFPAQLKNLNEVIQFNSPGTFFVRAIVANVQYCLYKACPLKTVGLPCKKKLTEELYCESCDHHAVQPLNNLYLRMDLRDCEDIETSKQITAFSSTAVKYLGIKIDEFSRLAEQRPKKLASLLQSKIEETVALKLVVKPKGETLDWVISSIRVLEQAAAVDDCVGAQKGANKDGIGSDDDDIYTIDDAECTRMPPPKRPRKTE